MATLTNEASLMLGQVILTASRSAISLLVSAAGATRFGSPDGRTTNPYGRAHAHASRSRDQVKAKASMIHATSGQHGLISFESAALQRCLESRLKDRLQGSGSTSFTLTWKPLVTPSGRQYCLLRASAHHKEGTEHGSWQTPTTRDGKGESGKGNRIRRGKNGRLHVANLCDQLVDLGRRDLVRSSIFRCHLMGYPTSWEDAAHTVTLSSRKSARRSSKQQREH